jgi:uncharacterized protein (DUF2164 family)
VNLPGGWELAAIIVRRPRQRLPFATSCRKRGADGSSLAQPALARGRYSRAIMSIDIPKDARTQAIASIQRYFEAHMEDKIGNIAAGALLGYFLEEIAPLVYNQAVTDVQERLMARISELDIDIHEEPFQYWQKYDQQRKRR